MSAGTRDLLVPKFSIQGTNTSRMKKKGDWCDVHELEQSVGEMEW